MCEERKKSGIHRADLIDILNETKTLNDEYSAGLAVQMLLAGHETTGTVLGFLVYELCCNVDIQNRLRNEIQDVLKNNFSDISYSVIKKMTYLDMVVNEALRKYPVLPFLDRRCGKVYKVPGTDLVIEKGVAVYIPVLALHYDEKYYANPEKFDPEHFSSDNKQLRPTYTYMPFGEGMRYCIGNKLALLAMKIFVIKTVFNFKIEPSKETPESIVFDPKSSLLVPQNGKLQVKFIKI